MKRLISLLISAAIIVSAALAPVTSGVSAKSAAEQRLELEQRLKKIDEGLSRIDARQRDTKEYLAVLDERLVLLESDYALAQEELSEVANRAAALERRIGANERTIDELSLSIDEHSRRLDELNAEYDEAYDACLSRMRAIYISGGAQSMLSLLLSSDGIDSLLARLEMLNAISRRDAGLLNSVRQQSNAVINERRLLSEKKERLTGTCITLEENRRSLGLQQTALMEKREQLGERENQIAGQRSEANALLKSLNEQNREYSEFRDITQEELDAIDNAIAQADKKYPADSTPKPAESTSAAPSQATEPTAKKHKSKHISLIYPCPEYTQINCRFGEYYRHTGCDFSTKKRTDCRIVAAESGTVIVSADLHCDRSKCKKSHHGGGYCSYGRYIVIRHDKTTKDGRAVYTVYAHNNKRVASQGDYVEQGQLIACSGSTGNSSGPHLHFEVRVGGSGQSCAVDPEKYLPQQVQ